MSMRQPAYVSPVHAVERIRINARRVRWRSRPDFTTLYALAVVGGMISGFLLSVFA